MNMTASATDDPGPTPLYLVLRVDPMPSDGAWAPSDRTIAALEAAIANLIGDAASIISLSDAAIPARALLAAGMRRLREIHELQIAGGPISGPPTMELRFPTNNWPGFMVLPVVVQARPSVIAAYGRDLRVMGETLEEIAVASIARDTGWMLHAVNLATLDQLLAAPVEDQMTATVLTEVLRGVVEQRFTSATTSAGVTAFYNPQGKYLGLVHYTFRQWQKVSQAPGFSAYAIWKRRFTRLAQSVSAAYEIEVRAYSPYVVSKDGTIDLEQVDQMEIRTDWVSEFRPSSITTDRAIAMMLETIAPQLDPPCMHRLYLVGRDERAHHIATYHVLFPGTHDRLIRATHEEAKRRGLPLRHESRDSP